MREEKMVAQRKLAALLLINGCKLNNVSVDRKNPNRDVYFFESSSKLDEVLNQYQSVKDDIYKLDFNKKK